MSSRRSIVFGFAVLMLPCFAQGALPQYDDYEHLGVQSCGASSCHGSAGVRNTYAVLQNEYITWARHDLHARAYKVLKNEQSQRIAANLGLEAAHTAKICLDCHTDNVPRDRRGLQFQLSDGVSCEACHGGAGQWLGIHISGGGDKHAESRAAGLYPTEDPEARAKLCLSCHLGTGDKFATHEIMGAGHPRLSFDLQKFTDIQPRHYRVDNDYRARKNYVEDTRVWAIGQVAAAREYMGLLQGPRLSSGGMFPELGLFDCHACHHSLKEHAWQANERTATPPGTVLLNDSSLAMSHVIARVIMPAAANSLLSAIRELHLASQTDAAALRAAAAALDSQLEQLAGTLRVEQFGRQENSRMIAALSEAVGEMNFTDYSDAEQATMALDVYSGITGQYKDEVDALYDTVTDVKVRDAKRFDPMQFAAVFGGGSGPAPAMRQTPKTVQPAPVSPAPVVDRAATRAPEAAAKPATPLVASKPVDPSPGTMADQPATRAPAQAPRSFEATHVVSADALRVRFQPGTDAGILGMLYREQKVQLVNSSGEWSQVAFESNGVIRTGWVASSLIVGHSGAARPAARPAQPVATGKIPPLVTKEPLPAAAPAAPVGVSPDEEFAPMHVVNADALRVRFQPGTDAGILGLLYREQKVQLLQSDGEWSRVAFELDGVIRRGWVASSLIVGHSGAARPSARPAQPVATGKIPPLVTKEPLPAAAPAAPVGVSPDEEFAPMHVVNADALRVRFQPTTDAGILGMLYGEQQVQLLQSDGAWSRVAFELDGVIRRGWVASSLIMERSGSAMPAARPAPRIAPERASPLVTREPLPAAAPAFPAAVSPGERVVPTHAVNANALRVRSSADAGAAIRNTLYFGDQVRVLTSTGGWSRIVYNDASGATRRGWIASEFLDPL